MDSRKKITAVVISNRRESWEIADVPLFAYTEGYNPAYTLRRDQKRNRGRVDYLARRRNDANRKALELHPDCEHIMAVDSFYLHQTRTLERLIDTYISIDEECILGASTWAVYRLALKPVILFYDTWSTPEMEHYPPCGLVSQLPTGIVRVSSVGACYVHPRWVWEKYGYGIPEPFPAAGIFHNWLCQRSNLPVYMDFDLKLWRTHADNPDIANHGVPHRAFNTLHKSFPSIPGFSLGNWLMKWGRRLSRQ